MIIERKKPIGEHKFPLEHIIHFILNGVKENRYNTTIAHILIMKQIEYCRKRDEIYERAKKETEYQARLEWNRLMD